MSDLKRVEELTMELLDGDGDGDGDGGGAGDDAGRKELERLIDQDEEARARFVALVEQEAALRGMRQDVDVVEQTVATIRSLQDKRIENGVMAQIKDRAAAVSDPAWDWLWSRRTWKWTAAVVAVALVLVGIQTVRVAIQEADPQEAYVYGQLQMTPGAASVQRVFVRNGRTQAPLAGARVRLALYRPGGAVALETTARTDEHGFALFEPTVASDGQEGDYRLEAVATSDLGTSKVTRTLAVGRSFKVLVTTDKPLYQPGQTIRIRSLSLATADMRPIAGRDVVFEVRDAKGNKVFKKRIATSAHGIAAADFRLADQVNTGEYAVSAQVGDTRSERSVTVKRYRLPTYRVDITTERSFYRPGATISGEIRAGYTFGEAVTNARVEVAAQSFVTEWQTFASAAGKTGPDGVFRFEIPLASYFAGTPLRQGDASVSLVATVVDTGGHQQKKTHELIVSEQPIRVEIFPESGKLVPGVENTIYVMTVYPDGRPAKTTLVVGGSGERIATTAAGFAGIHITPPPAGSSLDLEVVDAAGARVRVSRMLPVDSQVNPLLLRTDRAVYRSGDTATVTVHAPSGSGVVFLDAVKDRRTVLTRSVTLAGGRGELALDLPQDLFGTIELHAYRIMATGQMVGDARVIQIHRASDLAIAAELDKKTYRPAQRALLRLAVTARDGSPAPAALGLAGVDEAVFALSEMRPGLERVYFALQEQLLTPRYELHGHGHLLAERDHAGDPDLQEATVALLSQAEAQSPPARDGSQTYGQKSAKYRQAEREHYRNLLAAAALVPGLLYLAFALLLVAHAIWRLRIRTPVECDPLEVRSFRRGVRWLMAFWLGGFYLPLASIAALESRDLPLALIIAALAVLALVALAMSTKRVRRHRITEALPLLRRLLSGVPVAAVLGIGGFCAVLAAGEARPRILSGDTVGVMMLVMIAANAVFVGALSAGAGAALVPTGVARWLGRLVSRTLLAWVPIALPLLCVTAGVRYENSVADMAVQSKMAVLEGADQAQPGQMEIRPGTTAMATKPLQKPTRVRRHFPETLLWIPELVTDERGRAEVEIPLADSITTWRLAMGAVSSAGQLGSATAGLRVFQDFFVDIDAPVALTQNDRVSVPVTVYNYLDRPQTVRLDLERRPWFALAGPGSRTVQIGPREVTSASFTVIARRPGSHALTVRASASDMADAVERTVRVEPDGKAVVHAIAGQLDGARRHAITIPDHAIDGASDLFVKVYPGSFSQVVEGLDSIFRMPSGCFEQTSSTTYPNVLVLDYMRQTRQTKPAIEIKALEYIALGYQRLLSFEVSGGGFEWFGKDPAHTVLTAYGLLEFSDMARVYDVDPDVIARTRQWLLSRQNQDGSWAATRGGISEGAINQYRDQTVRTTCYVTWAMAESAGSRAAEPGVQRALNYITARVGDEKDPYTLAVCANALGAAKHPGAAKVLGRLDTLKQSDGKLVHWTSTREGAFHSRGDVLDIETTAIAAQAYLKAKQDISTAHAALAWLTGKKDQYGNWHSTQATVHAFRALLLGAGPSSPIADRVTVAVSVNGEVAEKLAITAENADVFRLISLRDRIQSGPNQVTLDISGEGILAYQIVATHYLPWREKTASKTETKPEARPMTIEVAYDATTLAQNDVLQARVNVAYHRPGVAPMSIVDVGIPPGFAAAPGTFDALVERGVIERYAITGRQVILYIREIASGKPLSFTYQLGAKYPVKAKAPGATVYQYYEPELRDTTEPVVLTVREL